MYTIEDLKQSIQQSECWSDVCRLLNVTVCTFNFRRIQKLCLEHNINCDHFNVKKTFRRNKFEWNEKDIYCVNSKYPRHYLRRKVIVDDFMEYRCCGCGNNGLWEGKNLTLEVEHKNGINDDNRRENLAWLCPNCHSQTPTYRNPLNRKGTVV